MSHQVSFELMLFERRSEKAFFVVVIAFVFLFHNDISIDLGNIVSLNNS